MPDDIPEFVLLAEPISIKQLLLACKLVETGGEAKRMCTQGGVSVNGNKVTDPNAQITPLGGETVQVGKRKFAKIKT